jgi:hypothetical protein
MKRKLMTTLAAAALVAGAGLASAQGTKTEKDTPGAGMEQKGPATEQRGKNAQPQQQGTQRPAQGAQREQSPGAKPGMAKDAKDDDRDQRRQGAQRDQSPGAKPGMAQDRDQKPGMAQDRDQKPGAKPDKPDTAQSKAGTSVTLNTEQKTKIRQTIIQKSDAPRVSNVNFSISVGTVVPRERVRLVAVPPTLIEIHPAWRGYMYFIVGDQLIIVEPSSHRIVAVVTV